MREGINESRSDSEDCVALVGFLFLALSYPFTFARQDPALSMLFSIYVTVGVFLLLAIRNPLVSRSLIDFTAWSSFAHAAVMGTQQSRGMISRGEMVGVAILVAIGGTLIALAPAKQGAAPTCAWRIHEITRQSAFDTTHDSASANDRSKAYRRPRSARIWQASV
jgi:hypothetical protein